MPHTLKKLISQAAQLAPSADNSQPWYLEWQGNTLFIRFDSDRVGNKTFSADSQATLLSIGACIENIIQASLAYNIHLDHQIPKQFDPVSLIYCTFHFTPPDNFKKTVTSLPLHLRHTNRMPYLATPLPQQQIEILNKMTLSSIRIKVINHNKTISKICKLIKYASEIRFRTQEIHEWLSKSFRFGKQAKLSNDGLDVATLDLPVGGSLFLRLISNWQRMKWLNRLGCYKIMSIIDSAPIKKAPALIAIIGKQGFHESLSAGQLMQRIWINLNNQGIAIHPYYVISDQMNRYQNNTIPSKLEQQAEQVYHQSTRLFELDKGETLHMLLRTGFPKKKAKLSCRLPLEKICHSSDFSNIREQKPNAS